MPCPSNTKTPNQLLFMWSQIGNETKCLPEMTYRVRSVHVEQIWLTVVLPQPAESESFN